ncbi:M23 family metallopeptidase [Gordonia neofelifaecis]|uniref:Peptidase M23 n=1 Tax=Gordonia neofelifaecis NRRL B-59395 TaxID=644548 RepID=F1YKL1_9ACTN|nr:M23 family metallopeptidase [Gordonia neofelifaecis]EGD54655.1 peptidase M23 [Gordonia neofelifaecis NRRL B-59395]
MTRDFPLPSRDLRLGLGSGDLDNDTVSTTEILITRDSSDEADAAPAVAAEPERNKPKHRLRAPSSALRARTALFAIAAGATAMAVTGSASDGQSSPIAQAPAEPAPVDGSNVAPVANVSSDDTGPGVVGSSSQADLSDYSTQLKQGVNIAKEQAAAIAAKQKPLVTSPIPMGVYQLTSAFAPRWGTFHGGIDMAAPLGTPIHAATDGEVVDAGPASGFGNWIRLKAPDGTITVYGHMASSGVLVHKGQQVTAGDVIALVGSEGQSTGPHLHFEKWIKGPGGAYVKIDPAIWLAKVGVRLSALTG